MMAKLSQSEISRNIQKIAENSSILLLEDIGLSPDSNGNIKCSCPIHGGDNPFGFSWSDSKKIWSCWTNKCHLAKGQDIIGLIATIKNINRMQAIEYVIKFLNININDIDLSNLELKDFVHKNKKNNEKKQGHNFFDIKLLDKEVPYLYQRGFNRQAIADHEGGICNQYGHPLYGKIVFPLYDDRNTKIGYTARRIGDNKLEKKWIHYPFGISTSTTFFGWNLAKPHIQKSNTAILVEGPLDKIKLYQSGIYNVIAILGTYSLSPTQIKNLVRAKTEKLILAFDPDPTGNQAAQQLEKDIKLYFNLENLSTSLLNDPGDLSEDYIRHIFRKYTI